MQEFTFHQTRDCVGRTCLKVSWAKDTRAKGSRPSW
jgi:hypothetical protein